MGLPKWWYKAASVVGVTIGLLLSDFITFVDGAEAAKVIHPYITDILKIRLYDKLYVRWFLIPSPTDIFQAYTSFLYEYRVELFRYGHYDDVFGWAQAEAVRLCNYDECFLAGNRFGVKGLAVFGFELLSPEPAGYFCQTFRLVGIELASGTPFKLGIHNGEVWGSFVLNELGEWVLFSGRDPFIDGLTFKYTSIYPSYTVDLIYYTDGAVDSYNGPLALDERIRVFSLRSKALEWTPDNPVVQWPPPPKVGRPG